MYNCFIELHWVITHSQQSVSYYISLPEIMMLSWPEHSALGV